MNARPDSTPLPAPTLTATTLWLLIGGVGFAVFGQVQLSVNQDPRSAALWYGIALIQWVVALWSIGPVQPADGAPSPPGATGGSRLSLRRRIVLAGLGTLLALLTFAAAYDQFLDIVVLIAWPGSVIAWWLALAPPRAGASLRLPTRLTIPFDGHTLAMAAILVVGVGGLFVRLPDLPGEMISDHTENVIDVVRVLEGEYRLYMTTNSGREPLFYYLGALAAVAVGPSFLALKIVSAAAALLTLPALYVLGRMTGGRLVGLLAMGLGAASAWTLTMGRLGFRATLASLAAALLLIALIRALRSGRRVDFLLVGLIAGLGQYGYSAFRIVPLVVMAGVGLRWLDLWSGANRRRGAARRRLLSDAALAGIVALLIFVPLLAVWVHYPDEFWFRAQAQLGDVDAGAAPAFLDGLARSLLMFNLASDPVPFNVIPRPPAGEGATSIWPTLGPVAGALFLLGVIAAVLRAVMHRRAIDWLLPLVLLIFVLPSALGLSRPQEMPSARRAIAALPVVMVLAGSALAVPVMALAGVDPGRWRRGRRAAGLLLGGGLLVLGGAINLGDYFATYRAAYDLNADPHRAIAEQIRLYELAGAGLANTYLIYGPGVGWIDPRAVAIWLGAPHWDHVLLDYDALTCRPGPPQAPHSAAVFLLSPEDEANLARLRRCFPDLYSVEYRMPNQSRFVVVLVYP